MTFDTWAGAFPAATSVRSRWPSWARIASGMAREAEGHRIPVILLIKGGAHWLEEIADVSAPYHEADRRRLPRRKEGNGGLRRPTAS